MTKKEIKKLEKRQGDLMDSIRSEVSSSTMDLIDEYVENELLLEAECNK